jgi:hypothetical protein
VYREGVQIALTFRGRVLHGAYLIATRQFNNSLLAVVARKLLGRRKPVDPYQKAMGIRPAAASRARRAARP